MTLNVIASYSHDLLQKSSLWNMQILEKDDSIMHICITVTFIDLIPLLLKSMK